MLQMFLRISPLANRHASFASETTVANINIRQTDVKEDSVIFFIAMLYTIPFPVLLRFACKLFTILKCIKADEAKNNN